MLEHGVELAGIGYHILIIKFLLTFGISFTSCPRVRSGVFSEYQYLFRHRVILLSPGVDINEYIF
jgi:hypothetical protein